MIFRNTQEAIIDEETFERVQELRKNKRRPTKTGKTNLFSGIAYCADCERNWYISEYEDLFREKLGAKCKGEHKKELTAKRRQLTQAQRRMDEIDDYSNASMRTWYPAK